VAGGDVSWERRTGFLLGLTAAAGALDALAFTSLGRVFASFQSGNVIFVGLGLGQGDGGLVTRAGVVLAAFLLGSGAGARLAGPELRALGAEALLLAAFAALWIAAGTPAEHPAIRLVLLAVGAAAMGVQAALALSLKIPNVVTVALTAGVAELGRRAGLRAGDRPHGPGVPSTALLTALTLAYATCAIAVAVLPRTPALAVAPVALLAAGVSADRIGRQPSSATTSARTAAAFSSRSSAAR
jgi:uncharacterized membrane protein YoaK (UPF0700 family)